MDRLVMFTSTYRSIRLSEGKRFKTNVIISKTRDEFFFFQYDRFKSEKKHQISFFLISLSG